MAQSVSSRLFRTKSIDELISASHDPARRLRKTLGLWSLVAIGIGIVIGSGIFTFTGTAAAGLKFDYPSVFKAPVINLMLEGRHAVGTFGRPGAGPAISVSFILVAIACGFAALCYGELASMIPVAGSAYTYAYATMGEIFAWIIGWDLILEYAVANMAVAVGFSAYFNDLLDNVFGVHLPFRLSNPILAEGKMTGAWFNLPAFVLIMLLTWLLVRGVREGAAANGAMVAIKIAVIIAFIGGASRAVNTANWHPFMPNGFSGVLTGSAIVFFTYIGFDAVSTAAEECKRPQRDLPLGIMITLGACAILYAGVSLVLTGIAHWDTLGNDAPVANALKAIGYNRLRFWVTVGALAGMTSSAAGRPVRASPHLVRDVARSPAAWPVRESPREAPDAAHQHLDRRSVHGPARRRLGHRHAGRPDEHRNAVRVCRCLGRRHHPAPNTSGPAARFSGALGAVPSFPVDSMLLHADAGTPARNLDPLRSVAAHRDRDLFFV